MAVEIERKFLATIPTNRSLPKGLMIRQGYLNIGLPNVTRVRVKDSQGYITIKGPASADGISRLEFEYRIPVEDAVQIIDELCEGRIVEKIRYQISFAGNVWELDIFSGANEGLIMAEVELRSADDVVELPDWVRKEVSGDTRYFNSQLALFPYKSW